MGMQVFFSIDQFDESCDVKIVKTTELLWNEATEQDEECVFRTAVINCNNGTAVETFSFVPDNEEVDEHVGGCWFDCGSASETQMALIKWLINNRICFSAS